MRPARLLIVVVGVMAFGSPAVARSSHHRETVNCAVFHIKAKAEQPFKHVLFPPAAACVTHRKNGYPLSDPSCTPGAANPTVTVEVLRNPDYRTKCVRNRATTEHAKAVTYRWYHIKHPTHNRGKRQVCELDHFVPLELGGADTLDNIWPQCGPANVSLHRRYFKQKDIVENYLARMVKEGKMSLEDAQKGIAENWTQYLPAAEKDATAR